MSRDGSKIASSSSSVNRNGFESHIDMKSTQSPSSTKFHSKHDIIKGNDFENSIDNQPHHEIMEPGDSQIHFLSLHLENDRLKKLIQSVERKVTTLQNDNKNAQIQQESIIHQHKQESSQLRQRITQLVTENEESLQNLNEKNRYLETAIVQLNSKSEEIKSIKVELRNVKKNLDTEINKSKVVHRSSNQSKFGYQEVQRQKSINDALRQEMHRVRTDACHDCIDYNHQKERSQKLLQISQNELHELRQERDLHFKHVSNLESEIEKYRQSSENKDYEIGLLQSKIETMLMDHSYFEEKIKDKDRQISQATTSRTAVETTLRRRIRELFQHLHIVRTGMVSLQSELAHSSSHKDSELDRIRTEQRRLVERLESVMVENESLMDISLRTEQESGLGRGLGLFGGTATTSSLQSTDDDSNDRILVGNTEYDDGDSGSGLSGGRKENRAIFSEQQNGVFDQQKFQDLNDSLIEAQSALQLEIARREKIQLDSIRESLLIAENASEIEQKISDVSNENNSLRRELSAVYRALRAHPLAHTNHIPLGYHNNSTSTDVSTIDQTGDDDVDMSDTNFRFEKSHISTIPVSKAQLNTSIPDISDDLRRQVQFLETKLRTSNAEKQLLQNALSAAETQAKLEVTHSAQALESQRLHIHLELHAKLQQSMVQKENKWQTRNSELQQQVITFKSLYDDCVAEITSLQSQLTEAQNKINSLQAEGGEMLQEREELIDEIKELHHFIDSRIQPESFQFTSDTGIEKDYFSDCDLISLPYDNASSSHLPSFTSAQSQHIHQSYSSQSQGQSQGQLQEELVKTRARCQALERQLDSAPASLQVARAELRVLESKLDKAASNCDEQLLQKEAEFASSKAQLEAMLEHEVNIYIYTCIRIT